MMNILLRLKHWQVFLFLFVTMVMNGFTVQDHPTLTTVLRVTGGVIYFSWSLFVGHGLYQFLPNKINFSYNFFIINAFILMIAYVTVMVLSDGEGMTFRGVAVLPSFYVFYAFLHYIMFPVRVLRSIEENKKARAGECIGDFFLIIFLPVGIWFLQPRINEVTGDERGKMTTD